MPAIKLDQYSGMLPAWSERLLPVGQAAYAENTYLNSGNLIGWRKPKILRELTNSAARMVYRIPELNHAQALAWLVFLTQPSDGDTVTVGDITYTFRSTIGEPFDVLIGTSSDLTATYLVQALTADSEQYTNRGTNYGAGTTPNGDIKFYLPGTAGLPGITDPQTAIVTFGSTDYPYVLVGAPDFGAAYNLVSVSASNPSATLWLYDLDDVAHTTSTYSGGANASFDTSITSSSIWLEFADADTNIVRSPVVDDEWDRYYFASPSRMPEYNTRQRISDGDDAWLLGVPPPGCNVTLTVSGGGDTLTAGNVTADANGDTVEGQANYVYLVKVTLDGDTSLNSISFGAASGTDAPTGHFVAVLYDDNAGVPGTLLAFGQAVTGITAGSTNTSSFINPQTITNGVAYWLGIALDTAIPFEKGPAEVTPNISSFAHTYSNGPPSTAPTADADQTGMQIWGDFTTSDILEARSYVYTWVSEYGEEGPPSPPTLLEGWSNGVWTLGLWQPPPDDLGVLRNLKKINIYRTVTGEGGGTAFFYVATVDIGTETYVDTLSDATVALNDTLESNTWFPPPANLQGIQVMQNGMIAGFVGNEIWFCDPYHPHAWPPEFVLTVDFPIVGLGVTAGALVVATSAIPFVVTGTAPGQMAQSKCSSVQPCSSRASIISGDAAVTYASPNGLISVTSAGVATNTTDAWFTREKWQQLTSQKYLRAILLAGYYYALGSVSPATVSPVDTSEAQRGFTVFIDKDTDSFTVQPHPGGHRLGLSILTSPTEENIQNILTDPWSGVGLIVSDGSVWYYDFTDSAPEYQVYTWRSKFYQQNAKRNYQAMRVFFTTPSSTPALNDDRLTDDADSVEWSSLPDDRYGYLKTYVDVDGTGELTLIGAREIRSPGEILRIPDGFKCETWQWEIIARVQISNVQIATSVGGLASV